MDSRHVMSRLKETLTGLLSVIPPQSDIIYADYPLYGNVGDLLIMKGTEAFLKRTASASDSAGIPTIFHSGAGRTKRRSSSVRVAEISGISIRTIRRSGKKSSNPFRKTGSSSCRNPSIIRMRHGLRRHRRFLRSTRISTCLREIMCHTKLQNTSFRRIISGLCLIWPISCIRWRRQRLRHAAGFILSARMGKSIRSCKTILPLKAATGRMCCQQATAGESLFSKR